MPRTHLDGGFRALRQRYSPVRGCARPDSAAHNLTTAGRNPGYGFRSSPPAKRSGKWLCCPASSLSRIAELLTLYSIAYTIIFEVRKCAEVVAEGLCGSGFRVLGIETELKPPLICSSCVMNGFDADWKECQHGRSSPQQRFWKRVEPAAPPCRSEPRVKCCTKHKKSTPELWRRCCSFSRFQQAQTGVL